MKQPQENRTKEELLEAVKKEIVKINKTVFINDKQVRTNAQIYFFRSVVAHMNTHLDRKTGLWEIPHPEEGVISFSYLDALRMLQNSYTLTDFFAHMRMAKVPNDIGNKVIECITSYLCYLDVTVAGGIMDTKLRNDEPVMMDSEIPEQTKKAAEAESERLNKVMEEKLRG